MGDKEVKDRVQKLGLIDQNLQNLLSQKQQVQSQLFEIDNALSELNKTEKAYKIVGTVMAQVPAKDLISELSQKKELLELRIKNIDKQESQLNEKAKALRQEVFPSKDKHEHAKHS